MRELKFDGLSPDGSRLILAGKDGQKWSVVIDERIEAAVRRDRARIAQVELAQAGVLRPREIQARIRSGATAEDVAAASGLPIEHVRRFEGPVLTERAWVAQQAQTTEVRRPGGDIELGDLVAERLAGEDVDPAEISWDAWRRDDGTWVVIASFPIEPNTHVATWAYDSGSRTMTVLDDNAVALSAIDPQAPLRLAVARPLMAVAPLATGGYPDARPAVPNPVPGWAATREEASEEPGEAQDPEDAQEPAEHPDADRADPDPGRGEPDGYPDPAGTASSDADQDPGEADPAGEIQPDPVGTGPTSDAQDVPLFPTPTPPANRPAGRTSVPSFDDILFGPGPAR